MVKTTETQERRGLTVLRIDSPLAQRLKVAAASERKSMKALAEEYISRGLAQRDKMIWSVFRNVLSRGH